MNMLQSLKKVLRLVMFIVTLIPALTCLTLYYLVVLVVDYLQTKLQLLLGRVPQEKPTLH